MHGFLRFLETLKGPWAITASATVALPTAAWSAAELAEREVFWTAFWTGIGAALLCIIVMWNIGHLAQRRLRKIAPPGEPAELPELPRVDLRQIWTDGSGSHRRAGK